MVETTSQTDTLESPVGQMSRGRALVIVALLGIAAVLSNTAFSLLTVPFQPGSEWVTFVLSLLAVEASFLVVGVGYMWYRPAVDVPIQSPNRHDWGVAVAGLAAGLAAVTLSFASTDALIPAVEVSPGFTEYAGYDSSSAIVLVLGAVLSLLVVGPVEEFLFRGVIQGRLRAAFGPVAAIGLAGFVFSFFHVYPIFLLGPSAAGIVHMIAYYTVMGAIFGETYERTNTLVVPVVVHGAFNTILFLGSMAFV
ncbi:abortive phage infection protein [Halostagnicola sp. A56]|uniref:CPBP family intramembrane glutamic endopeptidase n=1 Tax=Halostagnicola sp. A56 TaxID=1495067 RepID=UPI0004A0B765|nr:CPBP family intramembrane glutamic endopeptidase [Halostagnicola sp. A56]KMT45856.1 abortive phage infection protein [Halostagnicola sp. A56]